MSAQPRVRLWLNGVAVAEDAAPGGVAAFGAVPFAPGNLTAEALDAIGAPACGRCFPPRLKT